MARFTQPIAPTQDPNYAGMSRALPSWEAQSAVNRSTSGAIDNLSKLIEGGVKGTDTMLQTDIRDGLYKDIDAVRDKSTDDALTAATQAAGGGAAAGPTIQQKDQFQPDSPNVPPDAAAAIGGLKSMRDATLQGNLADSHYYMNLEAVASKYRARYPGYREQIDNMISQITGVDPANAMRRNAIQLLENTQKLNSEGQTKMFNVYHTDQQYFEALHPGMTFQQFMQNPYGYMSEAGNLKASKLKMESDKMALDMSQTQDKVAGTNAEKLFTNEANLYVSTFVSGTLNKLKEQGMNLTAQGANANPTEVAQFLAQATQLKTQMETQIDGLATRPLREGSANSYSTFMHDPTKIAQIKTAALAPIDTIIQAVGGKDYITANAAANINKMRTDQTWMKLSQLVPEAEIYGGLRRGIGDQTTGQVLAMSNGAGLTPLTKAVTDTTWLSIANPNATKPPVSASQAAASLAETNPVNPGRVNKMTVQGIMTLAGHDDPKIAARAVQSLYGDPQFFANIKDSEKAQVFGSMTSPAFTQKMVQLRKADPASFDKYVNWAQTNGVTVFKDGIDNLQSATEYNRYNVTFDPKTMQFTAQTKPEYAPTNMSGHPLPDNAQTYVSKINQLGASLAPILKEKYGDQAPTQFLHILEANGYNPAAEKNGGWIDSLGKAVIKAGGAIDDYLNSGNRNLAPGESPTRPSAKGKQSSIEMEDNPDASPLHQVIKTAESSENYNSLFGEHSRNLNLTGMSIGEVMALQQHRLAQGAASTAAGAYQILLPTLKSLVKEGVVSPDAPFNQETQDKLATALMNRRGLAEYKAGKLSKEQFANNLAKEWAGLPTTQGQSYYEGDGLNHSTVRLPKVLAALGNLS